MPNPVQDMFYWLGQINKASAVVNCGEGLITKEQAARFAEAIAKVIKAGDAPGGARPDLVITLEPLLMKEAGAEITVLHAGRSSQDMLTTCRYAMVRENLLQLAEAINTVVAELLRLAAVHRETIMPSYTNGVAAQPNSYGHYLLAVAAGFARDSERLRQYYQRLNKSPMGTTVLNGTSWPLNRELMAKHLGFAQIAYNAYDANQIYSLEYGVEAGFLATSISLRISNFVADVMQQYAQPRPWIILQEGGANTYVSSAMPQKRNPGILNKARADASTALGDALGAVMRSHNVPPGMADARSPELNKLLEAVQDNVVTFARILQALQVKPERALEELNLDWTASQEVADVLMRRYQIPFRIGHHVASEIVGYARAHGLTPLTFPYQEVQRIYREIVGVEAGLPSELPLSEADFKATLDPVAIVHNRATKGGPQPAEMDIMLQAAASGLEQEQAWVQVQRQQVEAAADKLEQDFTALLAE